MIFFLFYSIPKQIQFVNKNRTILSTSYYMKTHSTLQLLDQNSSKILLNNFFMYFKSCALNMNQLQTHKKELFKKLKSINVVIIFSYIDIQKKNAIFKKDLKKFLIQQNIIVKQNSLNLYFDKYTKNGHIYLDYEDFLNSLLPKYKFDPLSLTTDHHCLKISHFDSEKKILSKIAGMIIGGQINFIGSRYDELNCLINNSLNKSAQLWRLLDFKHINIVNFQNILILSKQLNIPIVNNEWLAFVVWNLNQAKNQINRNDFMTIFNKLIKDKNTSSQFNLDKFRQRNLAKKQLQQNQKRRIQSENIIRKKLVNIELTNLGGLKNAQNIGKGLQEWAQMIKIIKKDNNQKYYKQITKISNSSLKIVKNQSGYPSPKKSTIHKEFQKSNSILKTSSSSVYNHSKSVSFSKNIDKNYKTFNKKSNSLMMTSSSLKKTKTQASSKKIINLQNKNKYLLNSFLGYQVPKDLIKSCILKRQDFSSSFKKKQR